MLNSTGNSKNFKEKKVMKKVILWAMCMVLVGVSGAMAYDKIDTTLVQPWVGTVATGAPFVDVIGDANNFDIFGADFNHATGLFTLYTNWNPDKNNSVRQTSMLFINSDALNGYEYAINLDTHIGTLGEVVKAPLAITTSYDTMASTGSMYAGKDDSLAPIPVLATGDLFGTTYVKWALGAGGLNNSVEVDLFGLLGTGQWSFLWASATCANDTFSSGFDRGVPLPPSALLMGSGLLGLLGLGWRRRKS